MCRIRECRGQRVNKQKDKQEIKTKCINYKSRIVLIDEKIHNGKLDQQRIKQVKGIKLKKYQLQS